MDSECFLSPDNYIELFQKNHVSGPSREHVPTPRRTAPSVQRRPELSHSWIWRGEGQVRDKHGVDRVCQQKPLRLFSNFGVGQNPLIRF